MKNHKKRSSSAKSAKPARASIADIGRVCGAHRNTIAAKMQLPDAPQPDGSGRYDLLAATKWVRDHYAFGPDSRKLQNRRLELVIAKMEREEQVATGEAVSREIVMRAIATLFSELGALLRRRFENELPSRYVGRDQHECRRLNEVAVDQVVEAFRSGSTSLGPMTG